MSEKNILNMAVADMTGYSYDCSCGRKHSVDIKNIEIGKNVLEKITDIFKPFINKTILIVCDNITWKLAGEKVQNILSKAGYKVRIHIAETQNYPTLVPNEKTIAHLLYETDKDVGLILGIGSGTINDICKMVAYKTNIDSAIIATAPSMDGYASSLVPLIVDNSKITYPAQYPYAIICDTEIIKTAPDIMFYAGFGDIVGKYMALTDWRLTVTMNNEYYCPMTVQLVENTVNLCVSSSQEYMQRDDLAVKNMTEALLLAGIAMGLVGISRPASGSEHHLAHFWELDALKKGIEHPLHGNSVGVGTIVSAEAYKIMKNKFPELLEVSPPDPDYLREIYKKIGMFNSPVSLGVSRELFKETILNAYRIRPRYTIFNYTKDKGLLPELAEELTEKFYGGIK